MSKETQGFELSRRKVLAGLGGVGLASAGAGLGTSAFLNDTESFEGNTITAGELDLKVDWEEHYSYPQLYEFGDPTEGLDYDVHRMNPDDPDFVAFPDPENPMVWIHEDDVPAYMENTAIEAFPDPDGDGTQEINTGEFTYSPCEHGADLDADLTPSDGGATRTGNADTWVDDVAQPLINLQDVKPGDFGELTLSFHLCDNPGYVWLQAANVTESEHGLTEPEGEVDDSPDVPELAENIQTAWWYDTNGNNVIDESIGTVDVMIAVDTSGSLSSTDVGELEAAANNLAADLDVEADARIGGLSFGGGSIEDFVALGDGPVNFSGLAANGNTPMPAALDIARAELDANGRSGAETFIVLLTDGGPNYENQVFEAGGHSVGGSYTGGNMSPSDVVHDSELCETAEIAADVRNDHRIITVGIDDDGLPTNNDDPQDCDGNSIASLSQYLRDYIAGNPADYIAAEAPGTVSKVLEAIIDAIAVSEEVFHRGTLAADLDMLTSGNGIPLDGVQATDFDELTGDPTAEARECFQAGVSNYNGFP
ncbi:MAG: VWA domain-containing protein, partial [Halodesulfurarchaeum sp.]|nr:VWA domain-containing protein [Halodesulfurarchaeum sp.]